MSKQIIVRYEFCLKNHTPHNTQINLFLIFSRNIFIVNLCKTFYRSRYIVQDECNFKSNCTFFLWKTQKCGREVVLDMDMDKGYLFIKIILLYFSGLSHLNCFNKYIFIGSQNQRKHKSLKSWFLLKNKAAVQNNTFGTFSTIPTRRSVHGNFPPKNAI